MKIQINAGDVQMSDAIRSHINERINQGLNRFADRITRVEVHLKDENAKKGGADKRCTIEVRPANRQPMAVEEGHEDLYTAITAAAHKAERAVAHLFERLDERKT